MKSVLINIGILLGILFVYYIDLFGWFTGNNALIFAFSLVFIVFLVGLKVLGNPFSEDKKNEK